MLVTRDASQENGKCHTFAFLQVPRSYIASDTLRNTDIAASHPYIGSVDECKCKSVPNAGSWPPHTLRRRQLTQAFETRGPRLLEDC